MIYIYIYIYYIYSHLQFRIDERWTESDDYSSEYEAAEYYGLSSNAAVECDVREKANS